MARVGEVGGHIALTLTGINLSTAVVKQIVMVKPNGSLLRVAATFVTDGTDGSLIYHFIAGDLSAAGDWSAQIYATFSGGAVHWSSIYSFKIDANLAS